MSVKKRGLGKGLNVLLSDAVTKEVAIEPKQPLETPENLQALDSQLKLITLDQIKPGRYQPRQQFDETALGELAQSIKAQGVIQPVVVRQTSSGYELIAGERRWRAAQLAQLPHIPAIIKELPDESAIAMSLIENIQRQDLNVIEEAVALDRLQQEFKLTHQEVADAVGKSRTAVSNILRLLKLNIEVKEMIISGELDMGHARALLPLSSYQQIEVAHAIVEGELSVRQAEALVKQQQEGPVKKVNQTIDLDPNIKSLQNRLSDQLCAKVQFKHQPKGNGQLIIHYNSIDELDGILEHIE